MNITIELNVTCSDAEPLESDVCAALRRQLPILQLTWNDPSLGRVLDATIEVVDAFRS